MIYTSPKERTIAPLLWKNKYIPYKIFIFRGYKHVSQYKIEEKITDEMNNVFGMTSPASGTIFVIPKAY